MSEQIPPSNIWLMQAEIQEAIEKIVRRRVGWDSVQFDFAPTPEIRFNDAKEITINVKVKARDSGDVIEIDRRKDNLKIEFVIP